MFGAVTGRARCPWSVLSFYLRAPACQVFNHFFLTLVRILENPDDDGEPDAAGARVAAGSGAAGGALSKDDAHAGGTGGHQRASAKLGTTEAPGESGEDIRNRGAQF